MTAPATNPRGYIDETALSLDSYGVAVDYLLENVPELMWPQSIRTYARMRHDPHLSGILRVYTLAIRRARWAVDPAGCRPQVVEHVADDLGLPILGQEPKPSGARRRGFDFAEHLRVSLLDQVFGHMAFEQSYAEGADGLWHLAAVQERMPETIETIKLNPDGTVAYVQQKAPTSGPGPQITTADSRLVLYVNDREGANYFGRSLMRAAYSHWLIKDQLLRVHATSIRKFGMGIPEVTAPPGATPAQIAQAQQYASSIGASERAGAGVPNGFVTTWKGMTGSVPDALGFIQYLDREMTRETLTSLLDLAGAERGARSLGETLMDLMVYAQQAVANAHAQVATSQIVVPLVDANWGENESAPRVVCGDVGADLQLTAQDLNWMFQWGAVIHDDPLETWIRDRYGMPAIDKATSVQVRTQPAAPVPTGTEPPDQTDDGSGGSEDDDTDGDQAA